MSKKINFIFALFLCIASLHTFGQKSSEPKKALLINSYHIGYRWTVDLTRGIVQTLNNEENIIVHVEYLDSKRFPLKHKQPHTIEYFNKKYENINFDIILTTDNDALDFVIDNQNSPVFRGLYQISCGIGNPEDYSHIEKLSIVHEVLTYEKSFDLIFKLLPETNELLFITDKLSTGQIYADLATKLFDKRYPKIKLTILDCIDVNTLGNEISKIKFPTVIYNSDVSADCKGTPVQENDIAGIVSQNATAPLFAGKYCGIHENFIGGMVLDGYQNGEMAAKLTLQKLNDSNSILEKIYTPPINQVFNYNALNKYNIDTSLLPANSIIINKPESFWKKNKKLLLVGFLIIINLLIVIALLSRNIISQKLFNAEMKRAMEKANESNKLKTVFLENISHEMRTPLNSIVGFSDILIDDPQNADYFKFLKIISQNALVLNNIISEIFDFSLLKSHNIELEISQFSLNNLIDEILNESDLRNLYSNKAIVFKISYYNNHNIELQSDRKKTHRVLRHIIGNALKFTEEGSIEIKCSFSNSKHPEHLTDNHLNTRGKFVILSITDTGTGIPFDFIEYIFEPFRQANESRTNANRGLGLGLSISKSIIEIMGGEIDIKSSQGKGTTVIFSLPTTLSS